jgi:hypothetical protein
MKKKQLTDEQIESKVREILDAVAECFGAKVKTLDNFAIAREQSLVKYNLEFDVSECQERFKYTQVLTFLYSYGNSFDLESLSIPVQKFVDGANGWIKDEMKIFKKDVKTHKGELSKGIWKISSYESEDSNYFKEQMQIKKEMIGSEIVNIGHSPGSSEGGLAIDYRIDGTIKRVVFGYTDLGIWIDWAGELN